MSERRWHPILEQWVITATHRQDRTFLPPKDYCPLCPTKEGAFPTEIPSSSYDIAVFENRFPSLSSNAPEPAIAATALCDVKDASGVCEVILYTPNHTTSLANLETSQIEKLIQVWQDRYNELGSRQEIDYVFIFENKGESIGVTIPHPHGQIYAFNYLPPIIEKELQSQKKHFEATKRCLHCDLIKEEQMTGDRLITSNNNFIAFVPFYARFPYEVHVYSKEHLSSLGEFTSTHINDLAQILKTVLTKFDNLWQMSLPYIMVMHQEPTDNKDHPGCHFHIEFYPPNRTKEKLKYLAGCESGAGTFINDTLPEETAKQLRDA